jgi:hypothetical protein
MDGALHDAYFLALLPPQESGLLMSSLHWAYRSVGSQPISGFLLFKQREAYG